MRTAILICLFVVFRYTANAQFSILPQLGLENSHTSLEFNDLYSVSKNSAKLLPQAAIRLDYKFKKGHGPFIGIATSRSIVRYNFSDPQTGMDVYKASRGTTQLRLEGGYQLSTKPIYFKKSAATNKFSKAHYQKNTTKSCGGYIVRNSCGSRSNKATAAKSKDKGSWLRIQPSVGVAYISSTLSSGIDIKSRGTQTRYEYSAGNWRTALISGMGFEFGKNALSKFNVSINYVRGIGNLEKSITTGSGNKVTTSNLKSEASGWSLRMGIPINLSKKKSVKQPVIEKSYYKQENKCGQYKMQYYRSRCGKVI
ncbi:MAG: hypothetical protein ABJA71_13970 [Ginsengibacter sp.]